MGWFIQEGKNEVVVSKKCAEELFKVQEEGRCDEVWDDADSVAPDGRLAFTTDHMEHMDYLTNEDIVAVLCKHKVKGDICFESHEGDNAGDYWGYRFDGKGGMKPLTGTCTVVFEEVKEPLKGKVVVITGTLDVWSRDDAHAAVRAAGGEVSDSVTAKTDYVVVGAKPGSKAAKARKLGRPMLDEKAFLALLKG
jgi:NAD-dependent DNA ligase